MLVFEKWQGLGNDFIVVEGDMSAERARALCDRRRGIGADGVLSVTRRGADALAMVVRNADGSRPEMCGNGLRCVAGWAALRGASSALTIDTDAGAMRCEVSQQAALAFDVSATMGVATVGEEFTHEAWHFLSVDMGNPHAVSFDGYQDGDLDSVGPTLQGLRRGGVNVELCRLVDGRIDAIVWERGVGRTLACGTGACAVAAAACARELAPYDHNVEVKLPGGSLFITVERASRIVTMRGPACRVYSGQVEA
jgi:diaminopimelate epimerase